MITEEVKIPQGDVKKLLSAASPDAALLYIYIQSGNRPEDAERDLQLSASRMTCAGATLRQLGLWPEETARYLPTGERPAYTETDVTNALQGDRSFMALRDELQRLMGRVLNTEELKIVLGFVRYLGLPSDVISCWCATAGTGRGSGGASAAPVCAPLKRKPMPGRSRASTRWRRQPPLSRARMSAIPGCTG